VGQKKLRRKPYRRRRWRSYLGLRGKTIWDWLPIVGALLIPVVIALGTWRITTEQGKLEDQRAQAEQELAEQRAQDEALQAYLDKMSTLLLEEKDLKSDRVRTLMRARTMTVLESMDPSRKTAVIQFLEEADLISTSPYPVGVGSRTAVIELTGADLSGTDLSTTMYLPHATLLEADLREANLNDANLGSANLTKANLTNATLRNSVLDHASLLQADVKDADLRGAGLWDANLAGANLRNADLRNTDLGKAWLGYANLSEANLTKANLTKAGLTKANLTKAVLRNVTGWTEKQLASAKLEGATMPDGQTLKSAANPVGPIFEDWLKSKDREENGKSGGSS
jgi:uncharacterized protein YjbI with pentapeptide repeats